MLVCLLFVQTQGLPEAQKLLTQIGEYLTIMRKTKQLGVVPTEEVSSPCGKIIYCYSLDITTVYNVCFILVLIVPVRYLEWFCQFVVIVR